MHLISMPRVPERYGKPDQVVAINPAAIAWVEEHPDGRSCTLHLMGGGHPVHVALTLQEVVAATTTLD